MWTADMSEICDHRSVQCAVCIAPVSKDDGVQIPFYPEFFQVAFSTA